MLLVLSTKVNLSQILPLSSWFISQCCKHCFHLLLVLHLLLLVLPGAFVDFFRLFSSLVMSLVCYLLCSPVWRYPFMSLSAFIPWFICPFCKVQSVLSYISELCFFFLIFTIYSSFFLSCSCYCF